MAPRYKDRLVGALEREGLTLEESTRDIAEDLAGVLEAMVDELWEEANVRAANLGDVEVDRVMADRGTLTRALERHVGAAIADVLMATRRSAAAEVLPGGGR